jgi:hypothetical protein
MSPSFYTVAVYLDDRSYGGPEEGGWYYDCGDRIDHQIGDLDLAMTMPHTFTDENEAYGLADKLNTILNETANKGRPEISSVLSQGRYRAHVYEGYPPVRYPERRPHYE